MRQGEDRWIALQLRIPGNYPSAAWNTLLQLKGEGSGNGPFSRDWRNNRLELRKSTTQGYGTTSVATVWQASAPGARDRWVKLLMHVYWSTGGDGAYELLGDLADGQGFRQLKPLTKGWTIKKSGSGGPVDVGARIGIYRCSLALDATAYFDGLNVASSRDAAPLQAFGRSV
jgi:hypothetical protein